MKSYTLQDILKEPIIRKTLMLVLLFFVSIGLITWETHLGQSFISKCEAKLKNQHAKRNIGNLIRNNLEQFETTLYQAVVEKDIRCVQLHHGKFLNTIRSLEDILSVISKGGAYVNLIPLNYENTDEYKEQIIYKKYDDESINVEAIELAPKLADLENNCEQLINAVKLRITSKDDNEYKAYDEQVSLHQKKVEALLLRTKESANKIYYDTNLRLEAIKQEHDETAAKFRIVEYITITVLGIACLIIAYITLRQIKRIIEDRQSILEALKRHKDHLDDLVTERTSELSKTNLQLHNEITDRKIAENQLRVSENDLAITLNSIGDAVIATDVNGIVTRMNPVAEKLTGWSFDESVGRALEEVFKIYNEETNEAVENPVRKVLKEGEIVGLANHTVLVSKNGEQYPIGDSGAPIRNTNGEITGVVLVFRDMTDERDSENELRESQNRLKILLDANPTGIVVIDVETHKIVDVNPIAAKMIGTEKEQIVGQLCHKYICPAEVGKCPITDLGQRVDNSERILVRADGTETSILKTVVPITLDGRKRLLGSFIDISEHKRAKDRIIRLNRLQDSLLGPGKLEKKLKKITDGLVEIFNVDFGRIWITKQGDRCDNGCVHDKIAEGQHVCRYRDRCLHLTASSGRYTHIDGEVHRRVPFDCYKIGRVASSKETKFLTNDVANDTKVHNNEWARELGLVSFAGYQLRPPGGDTIGVMALFAKHVITPDEDAILESLGHTAAQIIQASRAEESLQESEERHRAITEAAQDAIITSDSDGKILFWNTACRESIRVFYIRSAGKNMTDLIVPKQYHEAKKQGMLEFKNTGSGFAVGKTIELTALHKDGNEFPIEISISSYQDHSGYCAVALIRNIAERKRIEVELMQAQKLESVGQLAAGIAHEINTPIQFVGDNIRFMQDSVNDLLNIIGNYRTLISECEEGEKTKLASEKGRQIEEETDLGFLEDEMPQAIEQSLDGVNRVATIVRAMKDFSHPGTTEKSTV